jgi:hypothetical protein
LKPLIVMLDCAATVCIGFEQIRRRLLFGRIAFRVRQPPFECGDLRLELGQLLAVFRPW